MTSVSTIIDMCEKVAEVALRNRTLFDELVRRAGPPYTVRVDDVSLKAYVEVFTWAPINLIAAARAVNLEVAGLEESLRRLVDKVGEGKYRIEVELEYKPKHEYIAPWFKCIKSGQRVKLYVYPRGEAARKLRELKLYIANSNEQACHIPVELSLEKRVEGSHTTYRVYLCILLSTEPNTFFGTPSLSVQVSPEDSVDSVAEQLAEKLEELKESAAVHALKLHTIPGLVEDIGKIACWCIADLTPAFASLMSNLGERLALALLYP